MGAQSGEISSGLRVPSPVGQGRPWRPPPRYYGQTASLDTPLVTTTPDHSRPCSQLRRMDFLSASLPIGPCLSGKTTAQPHPQTPRHPPDAHAFISHPPTIPDILTELSLQIIIANRDKQTAYVSELQLRETPSVETFRGRFEDLTSFDRIATAGNPSGLIP